jgi:hypothetical protein
MLPLSNCPFDANAFLEVALRRRHYDKTQSLELSKAKSVESSDIDKIDSLKEEAKTLNEKL